MPTGLRKPSMPASWGRHKGVPRFYLNLRSRDRLIVDPEGDDLASADAVQGHALEIARDLIARARMDGIRNWFDCSFEVTNEAGQVVLVLPCSEAPQRERSHARARP